VSRRRRLVGGDTDLVGHGGTTRPARVAHSYGTTRLAVFPGASGLGIRIRNEPLEALGIE
jgi:hypothetical protein